MQHNTFTPDYTSRELTAFYGFKKFCPFMIILGTYSQLTREQLLVEAVYYNLDEEAASSMCTRELIIRVAAAMVERAKLCIPTGDLRYMYEKRIFNEEDLAYLGLDLTDIYTVID